jgi:hypothetical protein
MHDLRRYWSCIGPFGCIAPYDYLTFQSFDFDHTWWRILQKRAVCTTFDIYVFIWLICFGTLVLLLPTTNKLHIFGFSIFWLWCTCWRLFQIMCSSGGTCLPTVLTQGNWSNTKETTPPFQSKVTCSRHQLPDKDADFALSNNYTLVSFKSYKITKLCVFDNHDNISAEFGFKIIKQST